VQDHLKSIFDKTGVRTRGELVGQIFLDHYATRWESPPGTPPGILVRTINPAPHTWHDDQGQRTDLPPSG